MYESLLLVVIGLNIWADFMDRRAARGSNVFAMSLWTTVVQFLLVLPLIGLAHTVTAPQLVICVLVGAFSALARIAWYQALSQSRERLSRLAPFSRISSVIVLAFAFVVLGEVFTPPKAFGAGLMILGAFTMSFDRTFTTPRDYFTNNRALGLVLIFAFSTASISIFYKYMLNNNVPIISVYFYLKLFQLISISMLTFHKEHFFNSYSSILNIKLFVKARAVQTVAAFIFLFVLRYLDLSVVEPIAAAATPIAFLAIEKYSDYRRSRRVMIEGAASAEQPQGRRQRVKYVAIAIIAVGLLVMVGG